MSNKHNIIILLVFGIILCSHYYLPIADSEETEVEIVNLYVANTTTEVIDIRNIPTPSPIPTYEDTMIPNIGRTSVNDSKPTPTPYSTPYFVWVEYNPPEEEIEEEEEQYEEVEEIVSTPTPSPTPVQKEIYNPDKPVNLIVDTDLGSDIDDACAIRIASSLAKQGRINLLACGSCLDGDYAARAIHGILSYDGLWNVPIGMSRHGVDLEQNYTNVLVSRYCDYPTYNKVDCVDLYKESIRKCMASGERLRIVTTGFLINVQDLLSDPEGYELIKQGVDSIWIVGGTYPIVGKDFNFCWGEQVINSIRFVNMYCPVPIVYITNSSGCNYETMMQIWCGGGLMRIDPDKRDPINAAFREFEENTNAETFDCGNPCWDGLAVLTASLPREETQTYIVWTDVDILNDGTTIFYPSDNGRNAMLERYNPDLRFYSNWLDELVHYGMR